MSEVWQSGGWWDGENCPQLGLCVQEKVPSPLPYQSRTLLYLDIFSLCWDRPHPGEWAMVIALCCSQASLIPSKVGANGITRPLDLLGEGQGPLAISPNPRSPSQVHG